MSVKQYWVVGNHAARTVLKLGPERIIRIVCAAKLNSDQRDIVEQLDHLGLRHEVLDKQAMSALLKTDHHQGIALEVRAKPELGDRDLLQRIKTSAATPWLFLVLDQVQDPHNLGACLRTADAAGAHGLIVPKDNSAPLSSVVHKVASGAAETVDLYRVTNLSRSLDSLKQQGIWVMGTSDKAKASIYAQDLTVPMALVMGAEGKGVRRLTEKACDVLMSLPMAGDSVSSLNVSVATGVCLYEAVRQRSV